jgi:hypothetical protein
MNIWCHDWIQLLYYSNLGAGCFSWVLAVACMVVAFCVHCFWSTVSMVIPVQLSNCPLFVLHPNSGNLSLSNMLFCCMNPSSLKIQYLKPGYPHSHRWMLHHGSPHWIRAASISCAQPAIVGALSFGSSEFVGFTMLLGLAWVSYLGIILACCRFCVCGCRTTSVHLGGGLV